MFGLSEATNSNRVLGATTPPMATYFGAAGAQAKDANYMAFTAVSLAA